MVKDLEVQAQEIKKMAEASGIQGNYFFVTAFNRYIMQQKFLNKLAEKLDVDGDHDYTQGDLKTTVAQYNKSMDCANKTLTLLLRIIRDFDVSGKKDDHDFLMEAINGLEENEKSED